MTIAIAACLHLRTTTNAPATLANLIAIAAVCGFIGFRHVVLKPAEVNVALKQFFIKLCALASKEQMTQDNRKTLSRSIAMFSEPCGFTLFDFGFITRQSYNQVCISTDTPTTTCVVFKVFTNFIIVSILAMVLY